MLPPVDSWKMRPRESVLEDWRRANNTVQLCATIIQDKRTSAYDRRCAKRVYKIAEQQRDFARTELDLMDELLEEHA